MKKNIISMLIGASSLVALSTGLFAAAPAQPTWLTMINSGNNYSMVIISDNLTEVDPNSSYYPMPNPFDGFNYSHILKPGETMTIGSTSYCATHPEATKSVFLDKTLPLSGPESVPVLMVEQNNSTGNFARDPYSLSGETVGIGVNSKTSGDIQIPVVHTIILHDKASETEYLPF